jgi:hypothetical protein
MQRLNLHGNKPKNASNHQKLEEARIRLSLGVFREHNPADILSSDFCPP